MTDFAAIFAAMYLYVAFKAFQQLNVQFDRRLWVVPTSLAMELVGVVSLLTVVKTNTIWSFIPLGFGGGLGCLAAMWLHKRIRNGIDRRSDS